MSSFLFDSFNICDIVAFATKIKGVIFYGFVEKDRCYR